MTGDRVVVFMAIPFKVIKDAVTLDLTVNPDFSHVGSDEPQVTITQLSVCVWTPAVRPPMSCRNPGTGVGRRAPARREIDLIPLDFHEIRLGAAGLGWATILRTEWTRRAITFAGGYP